MEMDGTTRRRLFAARGAGTATSGGTNAEAEDEDEDEDEDENEDEDDDNGNDDDDDDDDDDDASGAPVVPVMSQARWGPSRNSKGVGRLAGSRARRASNAALAAEDTPTQLCGKPLTLALNAGLPAAMAATIWGRVNCCTGSKGRYLHTHTYHTVTT
jgi:hypothetical protein